MNHVFDQRLQALNLTLPDLPRSPTSDLARMCIGDCLHIGGQLPFQDGKVLSGRIGDDLDVRTGIVAARQCALTVLAQIKVALAGDWSHFRQMTRITIYINAAPQLHDLQPMANAASDQLLAILGDRGTHVRSVIGVAGLPLGAAVQIDATAMIQSRSESFGFFP